MENAIPGISNVQALVDTGVWDAIYYSSSIVQHDVEDRYVDWVRKTFLNDHDPRGILMSSGIQMGPFLFSPMLPVEVLDEADEYDFMLKGQHESLDDGDVLTIWGCLYHVTITDGQWFLDHMEHDIHGNPL